MQLQNEYTIKVFLAEDGYTAYCHELPHIAAGGETEEEALRELIKAYSLAIEDKKSITKHVLDEMVFKLTIRMGLFALIIIAILAIIIKL